MIIQLILSMGLASCLFYVASLGRSSFLMRIALFGTVVAGFVFVWFPGTTNLIASWVGVGRGADLIMYIWIVLTLLLIVRLHLKLRELSEALTQLARRMTLDDTERP